MLKICFTWKKRGRGLTDTDVKGIPEPAEGFEPHVKMCEKVRENMFKPVLTEFLNTVDCLIFNSSFNILCHEKSQFYFFFFTEKQFHSSSKWFTSIQISDAIIDISGAAGIKKIIIMWGCWVNLKNWLLEECELNITGWWMCLFIMPYFCTEGGLHW